MIDRVWLRISSAVPGQLVMPMTSDDVEQRPAQHGGQHERQRQERDHQEPLGEPVEQRAPASPRRSPTSGRSAVPITIEIAVASRPTNSEIRAPQISRVSTERPDSSVPSQYSPDGGSSTPPVALVTSMLVRVGEQRREEGDQR